MTATPPPPTPAPGSPPPSATPAERVRQAYYGRAETDYVFEGIGMNIFLIFITCGIWGYFLFYQLMKRNRDHNRRMYEELEAANEFAWQLANERGFADELRPNFERIATHLAILRGQTTEFRDPGIWLLIDIIAGGIGQVVGYIFIDGDFVKCDASQGAIQAELSAIFARFGVNVPAPDPSRVKGKHNYGGRIVASIFTCGLYLLWWTADMMREGNQHLAHTWAWEDPMAGAVYQLSGATQ